MIYALIKFFTSEVPNLWTVDNYQAVDDLTLVCKGKKKECILFPFAFLGLQTLNL